MKYLQREIYKTITALQGISHEKEDQFLHSIDTGTHSLKFPLRNNISLDESGLKGSLPLLLKYKGEL